MVEYKKRTLPVGYTKVQKKLKRKFGKKKEIRSEPKPNVYVRHHSLHTTIAATTTTKHNFCLTKIKTAAK